MTFALTFEQMDDVKLELPIRESIEKGHTLALASSEIPQNNSRTGLGKFSELLIAAKTRMKEAYNYDLHLLYNTGKMVVLKTVNEVALANEMFIFARNFHENSLDKKLKLHPENDDCILEISANKSYKSLMTVLKKNNYKLALLSRDPPSSREIPDEEEKAKEPSKKVKAAKLRPRSARGFNELIMLLLD